MTTSLHPPPGTRVAVIGGCGGIGQAVVASCLALDLRVTVLDLPSTLRDAPPPPGAAAYALDLTVRDDIPAVFAALGPVDALVNLAGFAPSRTPLEALDPADWDAVLAANLTGAFLAARAALPNLRVGRTRAMPSAAIVNVASGLAARLMPGYAAYGASKAGLIALTKALAAENAPLVRANAVAPGAVDTAFLTGGAGRSGARAQLDVVAHARTIPMGRIATPADVAGPILFLCGPGAAYMTGQVLWVNGGGLTP